MAIRTEFKLFLTFWIVYAVYVTPAGGVTPNRYVDLVHSIVNEGRFAIDTYQENTIDKAYYNGHYYAGALPGPAFLAIPAYVVFKGVYALIPQSVKDIASGVESYKKEKQANSSFYGRVDNVEFFLSQAFLVVFVVAIFSALGGLLFFKILKLLNVGNFTTFLLTISYTFGSILFWNSTVYFEQVFTIFFVLFSFYVLLRLHTAQYRSRQLILAGFLGASAFLVEFSGALAAAAIFIYAALKIRKWNVLLYGLGAAVPLVILATYDYALFANPLSTPYQHLVMTDFQAVMSEGVGGLTYPHLDRLVGLLLSPERGILVFAPISILGLSGLVLPSKLWSDFKNEAIFFSMVVAASFLFVSSFSGWNAGNGFGPRYLSFGIPFMIIPAAFILNRSNSAFGLALVFISVLINWSGAQYGFAPNYYTHVTDLLTNGPSAPIFEAIVSHTATANPILKFIIDARPYLAGFVALVAIGALLAMWAPAYHLRRILIAPSSNAD